MFTIVVEPSLRAEEVPSEKHKISEIHSPLFGKIFSLCTTLLPHQSLNYHLRADVALIV
jgi:hypothetical protein